MIDLNEIKEVAKNIVKSQKNNKDKESFRKAYNLLLEKLHKQDNGLFFE